MLRFLADADFDFIIVKGCRRSRAVGA